MRILFLSHYFPPEGNAPATRVHEFARRWVAMGHEVRVITCAPNVPGGKVYTGYRNRLWQCETIDGIEVLRVWTWLAPNKGTLRRIANYVSYAMSAGLAGLFQKRPDVVIATSPQMFCGVTGALLKLVKRVPFVLEIRDIWPESITTVGAMRNGFTIRMLEKLERWMYRRATKIVTVGPGYRDKLLDRGVPGGRIEIIANGIDIERYVPRSADADLRASWGAEHRFAIGYVGTVGMAAGLGTVLEAAELLRERRERRIVWLIIGDGAERDRLEHEAKVRGLDRDVVFTGRMAKQEMPRVIASLDACLVHLRPTPLFESVLPSKLFEMAAMERPILIAVPGYASSLVEDAGCGKVVPPGDAAALVDAASALADQPEYAGALGRRGRKFFCDGFDLDCLARRYDTIVSDIATYHRTSRPYGYWPRLWRVQ